MISKKKALYYSDRLDETLSRFEEDGQAILDRELESIGNIDVLVAMGTIGVGIGNMHNNLQLLASYGRLDGELYEIIEIVTHLCVCSLPFKNTVEDIAYAGTGTHGVNEQNEIALKGRC